MSRILRFILPITLLGVGVAVFLALTSSRPVDQPLNPTERSWPVEAVTVQRQPLAPTVRLYGRIESPHESRVRCALSTDVQEVWALVGQNVSKGEQLLRLDDLDVKLTLAQREAELTEIEAQIQSENTRYQTDRAALERKQNCWHWRKVPWSGPNGWRRLRLAPRPTWMMPTKPLRASSSASSVGVALLPTTRLGSRNCKPVAYEPQRCVIRCYGTSSAHASSPPLMAGSQRCMYHPVIGYTPETG
jgi:hypothetical protein